MILRRLAAALRRQDWITVVIEFVIVVAGVLVALQVSIRNDARRTAEQEKVYLHELRQEGGAAQYSRAGPGPSYWRNVLLRG